VECSVPHMVRLFKYLIYDAEWFTSKSASNQHVTSAGLQPIALHADACVPTIYSRPSNSVKLWKALQPR
jgi:hypothetical protein